MANEKLLLEECESHYNDSNSYLETRRQTWPDYESIVMAEHREAMTKDTPNRVYDPRLSTIEMERTARIIAQNPTGKAKAVSEDDTGKNMLMNKLLAYQQQNANEQYDYLVKLQMGSFWSRVYGSMFYLVPFRVREGYMGPELFLLSMWDSYPQPNVQVNDADWFIAHNRLSIKWLLEQAKRFPESWNVEEIKALAAEMKEDGGDVKQHDDTSSHISKQLYPSNFSDKTYPKAETFTEYRRDKWITWAKRTNHKKSYNRILRVVDNPYPEGMLPVVAKHSFPLLEGPIGIGPFQRGKSLQFGTNSLINLFLQGVKSAVYPERMVNPNAVVPSSLKYGGGEMWFMNNPGQDVQLVQKGNDALNHFNSTYGLFTSSMLNQAGATDVASSGMVESSLGKTPQALRLQAAAQGAQDFWEQTMLESTVRQIKERWIAMNTTMLDSDVVVRVFGDEIQKIADIYPDVTEVFQSGKAGKVTVNSKMFQGEDEDPVKFDYEVDTGSMARPNVDQEKEDLIETLKFVTENPVFLEQMREEGNDINVTELFKRVLMKKDMKDIDKVVVQMEEEMGVEGEMQPQQPAQFQDDEIDAISQQLLGGTQGIPQQRV